MLLSSSTVDLKAQAKHTVAVTDHRPLWAALDQVEAFFKTPINYEDVPYEHDSDLGPVLDPRVKQTIGGRRSRLPRKGTVNVTCDQVKSQTDKRVCLEQLLSSYRLSGLPGEFTIEEQGESFAVLATNTRTADGAKRSVISPLRREVTVTYQKRSVIDTVAALASEITKATGIQVLVGQVPFATESLSFGAQGESARGAMARIFKEAAPNRAVSYRLLYDPLFGGYMLNFNVVSTLDPVSALPATATTPKGTDVGKWLDPATVTKQQ